MHRRCASWHNVPLHTFVCLTRLRRARHKVLHKSLTMKHCFAKAPQYEASPVFISLRRGKPFHSAMKHFAYAPYDLSSIALRATDDEKMENESLSVCNTTLSALYYDLQSGPLWLDFFCLDFTQRMAGAYSVNAPKQRTAISLFFSVFWIDSLKILCLWKSAVFYVGLFCNMLEIKILQKHAPRNKRILYFSLSVFFRLLL